MPCYGIMNGVDVSSEQIEATRTHRSVNQVAYDFTLDFRTSMEAIEIIINRDGRPSGMALVYFSSKRATKAAQMVLDKKNLAHRYVEVFGPLYLVKEKRPGDVSLSTGTPAGGTLAERKDGAGGVSVGAEVGGTGDQSKSSSASAGA